MPPTAPDGVSSTPVIGRLPPLPKPAADYDGFSIGNIDDGHTSGQTTRPVRPRPAKQPKLNQEPDSIAGAAIGRSGGRRKTKAQAYDLPWLQLVGRRPSPIALVNCSSVRLRVPVIRISWTDQLDHRLRRCREKTIDLMQKRSFIQRPQNRVSATQPPAATLRSDCVRRQRSCPRYRRLYRDRPKRSQRESFAYRRPSALVPFEPKGNVSAFTARRSPLIVRPRHCDQADQRAIERGRQGDRGDLAGRDRMTRGAHGQASVASRWCPSADHARSIARPRIVGLLPTRTCCFPAMPLASPQLRLGVSVRGTGQEGLRTQELPIPEDAAWHCSRVSAHDRPGPLLTQYSSLLG